KKRITKKLGINTGQEMIKGIESADDIGAELVLADRNIQITFSRIWGSIGLKGKALLLTQVLAGVFSKESITEEELEKMKTQDSIDRVLREFSEAFPRLQKPLIDERDQYLAQKIKKTRREKIVTILDTANTPCI